MGSFHLYPTGHDREGFYFEQNDKNNLMFLQEHIKPEFFDSFDIEEEREYAVDWDRFNDALRSVKTNTVDVTFDNSDNRNRIRFFNDQGFEYNLSTLTSNSVPDGNLPDIEYDVTFQCTINEIHSALQQVNLVANSFDMIVENGEVYLYADGDNDDTTTPPIAEGIDEDFDFSVKLNRDYLANFTSEVDSDSTANISTGMMDDGRPMPLFIETVYHESDVKFALAPKIEDK